MLQLLQPHLIIHQRCKIDAAVHQHCLKAELVPRYHPDHHVLTLDGLMPLVPLAQLAN